MNKPSSLGIIAQALSGLGDRCRVTYPPVILPAGAIPLILTTREDNGFRAAS
jgi:hypothetical protein